MMCGEYALGIWNKLMRLRVLGIRPCNPVLDGSARVRLRGRVAPGDGPVVASSCNPHQLPLLEFADFFAQSKSQLRLGAVVIENPFGVWRISMTRPLFIAGVIIAQL